MKKSLTLAIVAVFVIGALVIVVTNKKAAAPTADIEGSVATMSTSTSSDGGREFMYTMAQVAEHSTAESCWTTINGSVYDLTTWIPQHPGGRQTILGICGKDGSSAFNGQHGSNAQIVAGLVNFRIGLLGQ